MACTCSASLMRSISEIIATNTSLAGNLWISYMASKHLSTFRKSLRAQGKDVLSYFVRNPCSTGQCVEVCMQWTSDISFTKVLSWLHGIAIRDGTSHEKCTWLPLYNFSFFFRSFSIGIFFFGLEIFLRVPKPLTDSSIIVCHKRS